jgi:hypothetical protein
VEYSAGRTVSSNIAPSTATASVVHNKTFAMAYGGMPYFTPFEIFEQVRFGVHTIRHITRHCTL